MEAKTRKALNAVIDALQHLSSVPDLAHLEFNHIDQVLAKIVDLPTDAKQKNSRRNLQLIRQWMLEDGSGIVLLEVWGQVYWRLGDLNEEQFRALRQTLYKDETYIEMLRGHQAAEIVLQRIRYVQEGKYRACQDFMEALKTADVKLALYRRHLYDSISKGEIESSGTIKDHIDDIGLLTPPSNDCPLMNYKDLWKNDMEQALVEFYVNSICPGRTLLTASNPYLNLLQIAEKYESTRCAVLSLSASYMRSTDNQQYHDADHFYGTEALRMLVHEITDASSFEACFYTGMLLIHHLIVNEAEWKTCWSCHFRMLNVFPDPHNFASSDAAITISHWMILSQTAQSIQQIQNVACGSMDWLVSCQNDEATRIVPATGISRRLLYIIHKINNAVASRNPGWNDFSGAEDLQSCLEFDFHQWTKEASRETLQVALDTAETYRFAAEIYFQCRCFGLTPFHPKIIQLHHELYTRLLSIPTSGPLYTASYPIWPFFIASITGGPALRKSIYDRFPKPKKQQKGNVDSILQAILMLQKWLRDETSKAQRREGWWEDMLTVLRPRETMLCLGMVL